MAPVRQREDWGIPLREAIERWTPRELWERYRELAEYDIPLIIPGAEDPRAEEVRRVHSWISETLVDKLVRGELIASGIALPLKESSQRRDIPPELWPLLTFGYRFLVVSGNGLSYDQVLVREVWPGTRSSAERQQDGARPPMQPHHAARGPGRPSIMPSIEAEMRRRADSGEIESSLSREAEALAIWAQEQFTDAHVPKPGSIERQLGRVYRELNPAKRGDK